MTLFGSIGKFIHELVFPTYRVRFSLQLSWHIIDRRGSVVESGFVCEGAAKRRILELLEGK